MTVLNELITSRLLRVNEALEQSGLPYAFGGAVALGYCVQDPRGTVDLDVNIFVTTDAVASVLAALPSEVEHTSYDAELLERDGQARLHWDDTPVDIFLVTDAFHRLVENSIRVVPFVDGVHVPVLSCGHLAVFKTMFARGKDFVDIANMVAVGAFNETEVRETVVAILGDDANQLPDFDAAVTDGHRAHRDEPRNRFPRR